MQVPDDVTADTPGDVEKAEGEVTQGVEPEGHTEAPADVHENKDDPNAEAVESSEAAEGDLPADTVSFCWVDRGKRPEVKVHLRTQRRTGRGVQMDPVHLLQIIWVTLIQCA